MKNHTFFKKHKFKLILTSSIVFVVLITSIVTPTLMKDLYPDYTTAPVALRDKIEGDPNLIKLEMEEAIFDTTISTLDKQSDGLDASSTNNPSGTGFVSHVGDDGELRMTHYFNSSVAGKAVLGASFGKGETTSVIGDSYRIRFNGSYISYKKTAVELEQSQNPSLYGYDWTEIDFLIVDIEVGLNELTFIKEEGHDTYPNIDYAYIYADAEINLINPYEGGLYTFDLNDGLDPFKEENGGSLVDEDMTYRAEGTENKYRYGSLNGAVATTTLVVDEPTVVVYHIIGDCRPNPLRTFGYHQKASGDPYINSFSVNNGESRFASSLKTYESIGWNNYRNEEIAIVELKEGANIIKFSIAGDNINMCGISILSSIPVRLSNQSTPVDPEEPDEPSETQIVKFEAEDALIETNISSLSIGYENKGVESTNNPSGSGFLINANKSGDLKLTFNFTSSGAGKVTLGATFGRREYDLDVDKMFKVSVNGKDVDVSGINISKMKEGGVKYYDWFEQDLNTVDILKGQNTIVFTKVTDAPKILNLDYIYLKTSMTITYSDIKTYTFNTNDASDPSNPENEANPFAVQNGGSYSDSDGDYISENGSPYRYGNGKNASLKVTLVSERHTSVVFKLIADCRPKTSAGAGPSVFSYIQQEQTNDRANPYIASFKVNGSDKSHAPSTEKYESIGWNKFRDFDLAKVNLLPGENVIEFTIGGDNINFCGVTVSAVTPITLLNGVSKTETKYVFNVNDASNPSVEENEMNPFALMNKGSHVDEGDEAGTYKVESGMYKYGNCNGAVFTATIVASEDAVATIYLLNDCRPKTSAGAGPSVFSYTQQEQTNERPNPYIASFTINGGTNDIIATSTQAYSSSGWNVFMECELVKVNLKEGENVIVFKIGGDNINVAGLAIKSTAVITLGTI